MKMARATGTLCLLAASGLALIVLSPDSVRTLRRLSYMGHLLHTDPDRAIAALGMLALDALALWLTIGLCAMALSAGHGRCAAMADAVARCVLPAAARRLIAGAVGIGVTLSPAIASASAPAPTAQAGPAWPVDPASAQPGPAPLWPTDHQAADSVTPPAARLNPPARSVTVQRGDSLWSIAQRQLGPGATAQRVASSWPRWFNANRRVIGADPSLIRPGQTLVAPRQQETS